MSKKIADFEIVSLGVEHPDYFQGFGCACTPFEFAAYGIGCSESDALDDLLEMMAQADVSIDAEFEARITAQYGKPSEKDVVGDSEAYVHLGCRWNTEPS